MLCTVSRRRKHKEPCQIDCFLLQKVALAGAEAYGFTYRVRITNIGYASCCMSDCVSAAHMATVLSTEQTLELQLQSDPVRWYQQCFFSVDVTQACCSACPHAAARSMYVNAVVRLQGLSSTVTEQALGHTR